MHNLNLIYFADKCDLNKFFESYKSSPDRCGWIFWTTGYLSNWNFLH